jgi:dTDP-4-dehydrorhamnose 3,5-epimerase
MIVLNCKLPGVLILEPQCFEDVRGSFLELFNSQRYRGFGLTRPFVQDNLSHSVRGVLRGLHVQNPNAQAKLVSVVRGEILDVAVDVRIGSPTFGTHVSFRLSEQNRRQLYIPQGFAHGFVVISECADVIYKCDAYYSSKDELTIRWNDPLLAIDWGCSRPLLSDKDSDAPLLKEITKLPSYIE